MSATMNDLHGLGLNPFAVQLLAESMLKSAYVQHCGTQPLTFSYPVQREDCAGWLGVRITIEAVAADEQSQAAPLQQLLALIDDDAFACSFQTMGQYRTALLHSAYGVREQKGTAE